jgi:NtrC-family two-component system response regulator AlgB
MRATLAMLAKVSQLDIPVLLRGEAGSGKSVLARALHAASPRREHALVAIDCLGLGADPPLARLHAKLAEAAAGTVLFEEVGALRSRWQAEVALFLEGRGHWVPSPDIRVVATTQRDLEGAVRASQFRADLLVGLALVEIRVPPLRERPDDIVPLARHFLGVFARAANQLVPELSPAAQRALVDHTWPGNLRELRNVMQRRVVLSDLPELDAEALTAQLVAHRHAH